MSKETIRQVHRKIQDATRILVVSHLRPDGDALGSSLGLGLALQAAGKMAQIVLSDGVPANLRHLPGVDQIDARPSGEFDLTFVLDCSEFSRTGEVLFQSKPQFPLPDVNVDHHVTNTMFAKYNLVEKEAVATAEILARVLPDWDLPITAPVASALLAGIVTDTLGFRTNNMTPGALETAAGLMRAGANLPELYRQTLIERSYEAARYWGLGLAKIQRTDSIVWAALTLEDRKAVEYPGRDDADLINILASIKGAEVALVFVEQNHSQVKVSWRAQSSIDVSKVALMFGGGGHRAASGAELAGSMDEVTHKVLEATRAICNGKAHPG